MPDMIPVGNTGVTPDPSKSFGMLSAILGVKRQAQELQTGAYQQSTAASEAQKAQLGAQQQQAVQNFFQTWNPLDHVAPDGTTDLDSATESDAFRNAGNAKPAILEAMLSVKSKQLQNKQALAGLNQTLINQLGTRVGSLITDPDVQNETPNGKAKLQAEVEGWGNISPDNQRIANFYLPAIKNAKPGQLEDIARSIQLQAQDASAQQGQQNPEATTGPTGQILNRNRATGALSLPPAANAPATGGAPGTNLNPSAAQIGTTNKLQGAITDRLTAAKAADYERPQILDALTRARAILSSPNAPALGSSFEMKTYLRNALSSLGIETDEATDSNELVKNLARAEASRAAGSPVGGTDAGRKLLSQGTGSTHIDNKAALNIIDQSMATELAGRGYIKALAGKQSNPAAMQEAETKFLSTPNLIQAYELGLKKNPQEAEEFYRTNGLKRGDLAPAIQQLKGLGAL